VSSPEELHHIIKSFEVVNARLQLIIFASDSPRRMQAGELDGVRIGIEFRRGIL